MPDPQAASPPLERLPLGRVMLNAGLISQNDLVHALDLQRHIDAPLGEILVSEGLAEPLDFLHMLSRQYNIPVADLLLDPPDPSLRHAPPSSMCLTHRCVPWLKMGDLLLVAVTHPADFDRLRACLGQSGRRMLPVLVDEKQIRQHISTLYGAELAHKAATRVPARESCRGFNPDASSRKPLAFALLGLLCTALLLAPLWTFTIAMLFAFATLVMGTTLKLAAFITQISKMSQGTKLTAASSRKAFPLPKVSVLVPLLKEKEIAGKLIERLGRLT
ncbi:hypothetical protein [Sulfitobacter sp.]|uniref:GspE/PulE/PilB domain-containing protein n=1 Tax=Sulfitobacter sp. TaxID=1903071 RepID=UPI00300394BA